MSSRVRVESTHPDNYPLIGVMGIPGGNVSITLEPANDSGITIVNGDQLLAAVIQAVADATPDQSAPEPGPEPAAPAWAIEVDDWEDDGGSPLDPEDMVRWLVRARADVAGLGEVTLGAGQRWTGECFNPCVSGVDDVDLASPGPTLRALAATFTRWADEIDGSDVERSA